MNPDGAKAALELLREITGVEEEKAEEAETEEKLKKALNEYTDRDRENNVQDIKKDMEIIDQGNKKKKLKLSENSQKHSDIPPVGQKKPHHKRPKNIPKINIRVKTIKLPFITCSKAP